MWHTSETDGRHDREQVPAPGLTRRAFVRAATSALVALGSIQVLPRVEDGFLAPVSDLVCPGVAFGEERVFTINVVSVSEVGIYVVDVSQDPDHPTPVGGATVTIKSLFNGEKVVGTTGDDPSNPDEYGKVVLDISKLAERDDKGELLNDGSYGFNGSMEVKGPDSGTPMRDYSVGKVRITGASAFQANTHAMDDLTVYPKQLSFDDWDAHYNSYTFFRSKQNDRDHVFKIVFVGVTDKDMKVHLCAKDDENWPVKGGLTETVTYDDDLELYTVSFTQKWLHKVKGNHYCPTKDSVTLSFTYTQDGKSWYTNVVFKLQDAPIESILDNNPTLAPVAGSNTKAFDFTMPTGSPKVFKSASFSVWTPKLPLTTSWTPTSCMVALTLGETGPKKDNGEVDDDEIADAPKEPFGDQFKKVFTEGWDKIKTAILEQGYADERGDITRDQLSRNFDASVAFQAVAKFDWQELVKDEQGKYANRFLGSLILSALVSVEASFTEQFMCFTIPAFISFSVSFTGQVGPMFDGSLDLYADTVEGGHNVDLTQTDWALQDGDPLVINLELAFSLSVGAGIKGVLCIAISGTVTIGTNIFLLSPTAAYEDKANPHVTASAAFVAELYVQAFIFRGSVSIWSIEKENMIDNWPSASALAGGSEGMSGHTPRYLLDIDGESRYSTVVGADGQVLLGSDNPYDDLQIVPESDLELSKELVGFSVGEPVPIASAERPTMHRNMALHRVDLGNGVLELVLVPCEGVNSFTVGDVPVYGEDVVGQAEDTVEPAEEVEPAEDVVELTAEDTVEPVAEEVEPAGGAVALVADADVIPAENAVAITTDTDVIPAGDEVVSLAEVVDGPAGNVATEAMGAEGMQSEDLLFEVSDAAVGAVGAAGDVGADAAAQAAEDPVDDHALLGDPFLGFAEPAVAEWTYEDVEGKTTFNPIGPLGIRAGIAENGGVVPTNDDVICDGVFSDPRQRVVVINKVPHLFRIVSVQYHTYPSDVMRTRLTAARFDKSKQTWGTPKVIEFPSDHDDFQRIDLFDYDFDILVRPDDDTTWFQGSTVCVVLTGGTRPKNDDSSVYDVMASPVVSVLFLDGSLNVVVRSVRRATEYLGTDKVHMVCTPHVVDRFSDDGASGSIAFAFLHRSADSAKKLMTSEAEVSFTIGYVSILGDGVMFQSYTANSNPIDPEFAAPVVLDSTAFDLKLALGEAVVGLYGRRINVLVMYPLGYDVFSCGIAQGSQFQSLVVRHNVYNRTDALPEVVPWPLHGSFLYTKPIALAGTEGAGTAGTSQIVEGTFDPAVYVPDGSTDKSQAAPAFTETRIDISGFKGGAFGLSPAGTYLFFADERDGWGGDEIDPKTGKGVPTTKEIHRIRASKYVEGATDAGGAFCEDFAFCELGHRINSIEPMTFGNEASSFICSEIIYNKDPAKDGARHSLARLHYIAVPHSKVVAVEDFHPAVFALAGKPCAFNVTLVNHGNVAVTGFDLVLLDHKNGDHEEQTVTVDPIDPANILVTSRSYDLSVAQASPDARTDEVYHLSATQKRGVLVPGEPMTYQVTFTIPENWAGEWQVKVSVRGVKTSDMAFADIPDDDAILSASALQAANHILANDHGLATYYQPSPPKTIRIRTTEGVGTAVNPDEGPLAPGGGSPDNDRGQGHSGGATAPADGSGGSRSDRQGGAGTRSLLPTTDDESLSLGPAALVLGGMGALLLGYSKRREANEREES